MFFFQNINSINSVHNQVVIDEILNQNSAWCKNDVALFYYISYRTVSYFNPSDIKISIFQGKRSIRVSNLIQAIV